MATFDVVSKVPWHEVDNAVTQAEKEIGQRFDFKDTQTEIERSGAEILIRSSTEDRAKAALTLLREKLAKRKVSPKFLEIGKIEPTGRGGAKLTVKVIEGIPTEKAKILVQSIKDSKLRVQASIQADQLRVSGKNKDDLQACIQLLRDGDFAVELQFINFRD